MDHFRIELTTDEFERLNSEYPESNGSGLIGKRAEELVKIHFRKKHPQCIFTDAPSGADLHVIFSNGVPPQSIEIKGTASTGIAWQQLKVSSTSSWELLTKETIPVYRVCAVFSRIPTIYVLQHGRDFILVPEPRWTFKRLPDLNEIPQSSSPQEESKTFREEGSERRRSSKYDPLRDFLKVQTTNEVTVRFNDMPAILGFSLPSTAYKYHAYWANQTNTKNRPWAKAWKEAGFEVVEKRLSEKDGWVRFRRRR